MSRVVLSANIEVVPATEQDESVLSNLLELYVHDFSEFIDVELGPNGRFGYAKLPLYWIDPYRHPFLIRVDEKLIGFVFLKRGSEVSGDPEVWDMAEFFVVRGHRRRGAGTEVAQQVWSRFPGRWEVRVTEANQSALRFWDRVITRFVGSPISAAQIKKDGIVWHLFSFESK